MEWDPLDPDAFKGDCRGKKGFTSKRQARGAARVTMRNNRTRGDDKQLHQYKCRCGKWHNGGRTTR